MSIPLEDQFEDIIGKAMRGLRLGASQLAEKARVSEDDVARFKKGGEPVDADGAGKIAGTLGLDYPALHALGSGAYHPGELTPPPTLAMFNQPFGDMTVNFYLVWDQDGGSAAAFDTGGDCSPLLAVLRERKLTLKAIFLTHTHEDHIADLARLTAETAAPVYVPEREKSAGQTAISDDQSFRVGGLTITARATPGHSPGGTTYVVAGVTPGVAVVGDALFAGSMGGVSPQNYPSALEANRRNILSLSGDTILCPGHGPLTTVALELRHNPFYAGKE